MKKTIPKLLTLVCLLAALMGLSAVTAHAETISGTISGGSNYRYYEDKSNVPQWGPFISTKLKYFTRSDTGKTVPAYCMEPAAASAGSALGYLIRVLERSELESALCGDLGTGLRPRRQLYI